MYKGRTVAKYGYEKMRSDILLYAVVEIVFSLVYLAGWKYSSNVNTSTFQSIRGQDID